MSEAEALVQQLVSLQNEDGGWPYHNEGTSWTEPTAFAVLALRTLSGSYDTSEKRGLSWLLSRQSPAGGWPPSGSVKECTSVTSIATLAILAYLQVSKDPTRLDRAIDWIVKQVYTDGLSLSLLISTALNIPPPHAPGSVPWYPGTAGWVIPTAMTALTLARAACQMHRPDLRTKAVECCSYLLDRRCRDHGWNHGGSIARSENANSYPETTGLALLALRAAAVEQPASAIALAREFSRQPDSIEGLSWIQMAIGSAAHRIPDPQSLPRVRTIRDVSLRLLAIFAQSGNNAFLLDS